MNNPSDQNFSSPGMSTPPPNSQTGGLQDLGANQSGFISQFVNGSAPAQTQPTTTQQSDPQTQYSPAPQPLYTQQPTSMNTSALPPLNSNPADLENRDFVVGAGQSNDNSAPTASSTGNNYPPVQSMPTVDPQVPVASNMPRPEQPMYPNPPSTQFMGSGPNPAPISVGLPVQNPTTDSTYMNPDPVISQAGDQQVPADNSLGMNPQYNPVTQVAQAMQAPMSPPEPTPVFDQGPVVEPKQEENSVIGTHQVAVNEDYADNYNPYYQQQQPTQPYAAKPIEPKGIDFSRPSTIAAVNQTFADTTQFSNSNFTSTNLITGFDDSNNSMLPMVSDDDDDDLFADDDDVDTIAPYGFSDFDPNEQATVQAHVSDFDSHGLQEVAEDINADFSDNLYANSGQNQTVGVLTQDPVPQQSPLQPQGQQIFNYSSQIEPKASSPHYVESKYTQIEPQIEPVIAQVTAQTSTELSPAARLNQLLEAEEEAEKVIIQKQNQLLNQSAKPKTIKSEKESIFQQLNPDASLQGDIRSGMASAKPGSRYFLIVSLVVLISVIGFLLVLLGLTLI